MEFLGFLEDARFLLDVVAAIAGWKVEKWRNWGQEGVERWAGSAYNTGFPRKLTVVGLAEDGPVPSGSGLGRSGGRARQSDKLVWR